MKLVGKSQGFVGGGTQKDWYGEDEVEEVACPLCGEERRRRRYTEYGSVGFARCEGCDLIFTTPRIAAPEKAYWGEEASYFDEARLIFEGRAAHHRDPNYLEETSRDLEA